MLLRAWGIWAQAASRGHVWIYGLIEAGVCVDVPDPWFGLPPKSILCAELALPLAWATQ